MNAIADLQTAWRGVATTDDYHAVDVRWLKRKGLLQPGAPYLLSMMSRGGVVGVIEVQPELGRLHVAHRYCHGDDLMEPRRYVINLQTSPCHLGGNRHWFTCPVQGCGRRVAILYFGSVLACRTCLDLIYRSQIDPPAISALRRALDLREKLGWPGDIFDRHYREKPKGMHWRTYRRLCAEYDRLSDKAISTIRSDLGI